MHVFRDTTAIRGAAVALPAVAPYIAQRLSELAEYVDYELSDLVNIIVTEPRDRLEEVQAALGFQFEDKAAELIDAHTGWFELTYVLSDDGFGVVLYVPDCPAVDSRLLRVCRERLARSTT